MYFGLRPESLALVEDVHTSIHLELDTLELLGHEQLLYFGLEGIVNGELVVRLPDSDQLVPGETIPMRINMRELYFFNADGIAIYD